VGVYTRTIIRSGPFRLTASQAGIAVRAGLPGLEESAAPRANYVTMNGGGLTYRTTRAPAERARRPAPPRGPTAPAQVEMKDVTGATIHELVPTGRGDIVEQLNSAAGHRSFLWIVAALLLVAGFALAPWGWLLSGASLVALVGLLLLDQVKSHVVVFHEEAEVTRPMKARVRPERESEGRSWRLMTSPGS